MASLTTKTKMLPTSKSGTRLLATAQPAPSGSPNPGNRPFWDRYSISYMDGTIIPNYWEYATKFTLCDAFFSAITGPSVPNHLYTVAAQASGIVNILVLQTSVFIGFPVSLSCLARRTLRGSFIHFPKSRRGRRSGINYPDSERMRKTLPWTATWCIHPSFTKTSRIILCRRYVGLHQLAELANIRRKMSLRECGT